ncbi:hypothetical protein B1B_07911 [mine drainage metagenome]|uniref:Uncharacterized protein n=1 Tax=mine drainage metagenome TaxID=410659 RepID=T1AHW9_9ZZZZ
MYFQYKSDVYSQLSVTSKMDGNRQIKICPKCGSVYVNWIAGGLIGAVYKCDDCNYVGPFILEVRARDLENSGRAQRRFRIAG